MRRRSGFRPLWSRRDLQIGFGTTLVVVLLIAADPLRCGSWSVLPWLLVPILPAGSTGAGGSARAEWYRARHPQGSARPQPRPVRAALGAALVQARPSSAASRCRPRRRGGEERYELLRKFQGVLQYARLSRDHRPDRPGRRAPADRGRSAQDAGPDLAAARPQVPAPSRASASSSCLPIELAYYLEKEDKEFYDRARPDKLNMIKPLRWTGPSLYDLAGDRLRACHARARRSQRRRPPAAAVHRRGASATTT